MAMLETNQNFGLWNNPICEGHRVAFVTKATNSNPDLPYQDE